MFIFIVNLLTVHACTYFTVPPAPGCETTPGYSVGRSMELGGHFLEKTWMIRAHPLGEPFGWSENYGFVGVDAQLVEKLGNIADGITEGMNTEGLTISTLVFNTGEYQKVNPAENRKVVLWAELAPYVLGHYASVNETLAALENDLTVIDPVANLPVFDGFGCHWGIADKHGDHAVVEYLEGKLSYTLNGVGVMTNDPPYDWQIRNLNNFVNINPDGISMNSGIQMNSNTAAGVVPRQVGRGQNLFGLPGDFSPPSRFVRAFYLRQIALLNAPPTDASESLAVTTSILDSVMIPRGTIRSATKKRAPTLVNRLVGRLNGIATDFNMDFTQWDVVKFPKTRTFLYRTYLNSQWLAIDLKKLNLGKGGPVKSIKLFDGSNGVADATARML